MRANHFTLLQFLSRVVIETFYRVWCGEKRAISYCALGCHYSCSRDTMSHFNDCCAVEYGQNIIVHLMNG